MQFIPPHSLPSVIHHIPIPANSLAQPLRIESHGYHYTLTGNSLLPPEALRNVLFNAADPEKAVRDLRALYLAKGYFLIAVRAKLLPTKQVKVEIIEGEITQETSMGPISWFFSNLRNRPDVRRQNLIYRSILADEFARSNGKRLQIGFGPSSNPGGSTLEIHQTPIPDFFPLSGNVYFGNYGSRYSSRYLTGGSLNYNPGLGITLYGNGATGLPGLTHASQGSQFENGQVGLSSITPCGTYGFTAQWTHYRIGVAATPLNPTGNVFLWSVTGSQLLYADSHLRWSANEAFTHVTNNVKVYQELIPGGFPLTTQHYNYFSIGTEGNYAYLMFQHPGSLGFSLNYNQGVSPDKGSLYANQPGYPTAHFHYFNVSLNLNQSLPWGFNASLSASGQGAFNTLPQQQQWVLGGFGNLSAWYPGILVGDNGYSAHFQIESPSWHDHGVSVDSRIFVETGGSNYVYSPQRPPWQSLSDVGIGVGLQSPWGTQITAVSALPVGWNHVSSAIRKGDRVDVFFVISQSF